MTEQTTLSSTLYNHYRFVLSTGLYCTIYWYMVSFLSTIFYGSRYS